MSADDYTEIMDSLARDDVGEWEFIAEVEDSFPGGRDSYLRRYWISNAIDCGSGAAIKWMLAQGVSLDFRDDEGFTVLHSCLDRELPDKYEILELLIESGADVNARGFNDWTPLHRAAATNDLRAIEILLRHGADKEARTRIDDCQNAADEAEMLGKREAAKFIRNWDQQA